MQLIPINNPIDYFEITCPIGQLVWTFIFTWNESYQLFHVDVLLNGNPYIYSVAVLGGVFILPDFSNGYNFFFLGEVDVIADLGDKMQLMQLTLADAEQAGLKR